MTFVSYAQNFEDVMLWRALRGVERGFYIDVGAADPDIDSVTRAFHDRGWHGVNIDPVAASMRRFRAMRPRDVNIEAAIGATPGTATLHVVEGTGLSTVHEASLARIAKAGFSAETVPVAMTTLAAICEEHVGDGGKIHFLKIDVEGAEGDVLAGADFARFRPWIVLLEATAPLSTEPAHHGWEPGLLAAGYRFVWFDGLNRFYVAGEHADALAPAFATPPNVFDDFMRVAETEWARRVAAADTATRDAAETTREADRRVRAIAAAQREAGALATARAREVARLEATLRATEERHAARVGEIHAALEAWQAAHGEATKAAEAAAKAAETSLRTMRSSTSWRVTWPLRGLGSLLRDRPTADMPNAGASVPLSPATPFPPPAPKLAPDLPRAAQPARPAWRRSVRAVHQFHSGSATGDAITNAMLLTRTLLRSLGYESDIYVEHLDPLLAGDLHTLDALPAHDDFVLLLRHSMGYDAFDRVAALPASKVLMYHNITPPEFLADAPSLQEYAALGRAQLARLRPLVSASLADSDYNAIELRRLGFDAARTCTLLFDLDALRARATAASSRRRTDAFTILFVGRVGASKGQAELVEAFAVFRRGFARPSRLVIVGRHGGPGHAYVDLLTARIRAENLEDSITLTGLVPDDELHEWYAAADLYVSLSRHEGFGVPLVEAMAHGVPVLARPSGAVPYTLSDSEGLLHDASAAAVAARMRALADDAPRAKHLAARQAASLDRFALDRQAAPLLRALAAAGAAPPEDSAARASYAAAMRFAVAGHVNGSYSLAAINRDIARALEAAKPGSTRLVPVEGQPTEDLSGVPDDERAGIARLVARETADTGPELVISQHYPVFSPPGWGDVRAALFFWEESVVPAETVAVLNRDFEGVLAPSAFVAKALLDSGLAVPLCVVGPAPDLTPFQRLHDERAARPSMAGAPFQFLHVSSGFPRKGVDALLAAYARAFRAGDPVRLVIKVFPNPHSDVAAQIAALRARDPGIGAIVLIDRDLPPSQILDLYREADAMVLPTRGEGFNLPAIEAMAAGLPLIVTGFGGHTDFCDADTARLVDFRFARSRSHVATAHSLWVEPDEADLAAALGEAVRDRAASAARARRAAIAVVARADPAALLRRITSAGLDFLLDAPPPTLRIAWVSTWGVRCGIAEYSRHLVRAMTAAHPTLRVTVVCDIRTGVAHDDEGLAVRPVWDAGDHAASVPQIAAALGPVDPRVVVIQHQPGLLAWGALAELLAWPSLGRRIVVVLLHNTRHLLDVDAGERCRAVAALRGAARVLVHTVADLNRLHDLGIAANATLLPHGAAPIAQPARPASTDRRAPVIGSYGFFLPGKGLAPLIEATATLRAGRWPGASLRLVNAGYGTPDSADEIARCRALAGRLTVPVAWHTEFLPDEISRDLLRVCDVVALPYQSSQEASSAAVRSALSAGVPVAVTPLALFDDAEDAVFRLPGIAPDQIAEGLDRLLDDAALRDRVRASAAAWLLDRNWMAVGARLGGLVSAFGRADLRTEKS